MTPIIVLNLERAPERREIMNKQFKVNKKGKASPKKAGNQNNTGEIYLGTMLMMRHTITA